jgi:ribosomal protein S18 acetylase RimI-like enzyme
VSAQPRVSRAAQYWSVFLGVSEAALEGDAIAVTQHAGLAGYQGVWLFVRARGAVISAPSGWLEKLRAEARRVSHDALLQPEFTARVFGSSCVRRIGPSYQGALAPARFRPAASGHVETLGRRGAEAIRALRSQLGDDEWDHSGIDPECPHTWGALSDDGVVALGQLRARGGGVVDPCVVVHPAHRGRGCGLRVVSAMCAAALARGDLVLYQTALDNLPALAIAERLGFDRFATLVAVRLSRATPES